MLCAKFHKYTSTTKEAMDKQDVARFQFNSLALGRWGCNLKLVNFLWGIDILNIILWNCPQVNAPRTHWWSVNIGSGNGLVPSCNKPLPEPMLTKICHYMSPLSHDELKCISDVSSTLLWAHTYIHCSWIMYSTDCTTADIFIIQNNSSCQEPNQWLYFDHLYL